MRTLALPVAILLLTLLAQGEPLRESADEDPAQEDPEPQDQDVAISFAEDGISTREASGLQESSICNCGKKLCNLIQRRYGGCTTNRSIFQKHCCHIPELDSI